jgi:ABC-type transport system involved in cytochrome c biogenesis permease subunit
MAISLMAWMVALALLAFAWRSRLAGLVVLVGPIAFLGTFFAALRTPHAPSEELVGAGSWPHAHVLLASAGLALLGVAAIAGGVFLLENRRLKRRSLHPSRRGGGLPSLETLDRVNAASLAVGFPLLTLGVLTGMMWAQGIGGKLWTGSAHDLWNAIAWAIYAVLVGARFAAHQGARNAALSAVAGFAFLLFAVVGVGILV